MTKMVCVIFALLLMMVTGCQTQLPVEKLIRPVPEHKLRHIQDEMTHKGFRWGAEAYVRIFKKESVLEVWLKKEDGTFERFREFPICIYSGELGPKLKQGDKQSPEGFYNVSLNALNPNSQYHLSFNLGYPNKFDRAHGYTGDYLMVHGECVSVGCYAMGNRQIEQIYTLVGSALQHGQVSVPVHIYPFKMTPANMLAHQTNRWIGFWQQLKPAYDFFEEYHVVPVVDVVGKRYQLNLVESVARR